MKPHVVFVDVDDTLIRSVGTKRIPMPGVVAAVRQLKANGASLYLWSSGGADYARSSADELGITDCFSVVVQLHGQNPKSGLKSPSDRAMLRHA
jgi:phosphoglycolate phosphatase-like HAD superfamily hydrolase